MRPTPRSAVVAACLFVHCACLAGHARADFSLAGAATPSGQADADDPWIGVDAARRARVVIVWSRRRLMVSDDGGAHFRARLDGDADLDAAAVSPDGVVYALRGDRLGVVRGARERWRRVGFAGFPSLLAAGAGRVVWLGHRYARPTSSDTRARALVAISDDDGATWTLQRPSDYLELYLRRAEISDRGAITIDVTYGDCRSWDGRLVGRVDGGRWREAPARDPAEPPAPRDGRGRAYRLSEEGLTVEVRDPADAAFHPLR